ncbi:MAG: YeeE/YedE family protein [Burkholderiales bacterium]|nr:YeeE/YedE family protein [Burkholderiales bacterium]
METGSVNLPLWGGLGLGVLLGVVLQRSGFCARAALADAFDGKDKGRLRAFVLAMAVTLLGTQLLAGYGLVNLSGTPYLRAGVPLLGLLIGGALFGAGMMLAGGCPSRLIVRAAQGQGAALLSWLVFVLAIMASLEGVLAPVREMLSGPTVQLPAVSLPALFGGVPAWAVTSGMLVLMGLFLFTAPKGSAWRGWRLPLGGTLVGLLVATSWYVSVAGADEFETPVASSLAFVAPAQDFLRYLTMTRLGFGLKFGAASVLGVFIGTYASALLARQFTWTMPSGPQMLRNLAGGLMMALGGILAMGCTIGQGIAGFATLSVSSLLAMVAMVLGAWLAHRVLTRVS